MTSRMGLSLPKAVSETKHNAQTSVYICEQTGAAWPSAPLRPFGGNPPRIGKHGPHAPPHYRAARAPRTAPRTAASAAVTAGVARSRRVPTQRPYGQDDGL